MNGGGSWKLELVSKQIFLKSVLQYMEVYTRM